MFLERYPNLGEMLISRENFEPCPKDPAWWASRDEEWKSEILREAEERKDEPYSQITATRLMDFQRNGNRTMHGELYFSRRNLLYLRVCAEMIESKGRYIDSIIDGIWLISEESSWAIPAHDEQSSLPKSPLPNVDEPHVDLFAGETAGNFAYIYYLMADKLAAVSPLIPRRIVREVTRRVIDPFMMRDDYRWMGQNTEGGFTCNWNPWICSNVLTVLALLDFDPWHREAGVKKVLRLLDRFVSTYHSDGACDEGPSYWGAAAGALFYCLDLLKKLTDGKADFFREPIIGEMGRYIYRMHISDQYFLNFADCHPRLHPDDAMVEAFGRAIDSPEMMFLASYLKVHNSYDSKRRGGVGNFRSLILKLTSPENTCPAQAPYPAYSWMDGVQVMTARETQGSDRGFFVGCKGGNNGEAGHNHNDVGNVVVYLDGQPVLVDSGAEAYTAATFDPKRRYSIWTMVSGYHNLPTVRGSMQQVGGEFKALNVRSSDSEECARAVYELSSAYPAAAGIRKWERTVCLSRAQSRVEVTECYDLGEPTADVELDFLCGPHPVPGEEGIKIGNALFTVPEGWNAAVEKVKTEDPNMLKVFGEDSLYRLRITPATPVSRGVLTWIVSRA